MVVEYDVQAIINDLKQAEEMDPDKHDGCYALMRETMEAYSKMNDLSALDYRDLDLVYLITVGTFRQGIDAKKRTLNESHLPSDDKEYLVMFLDDIWERAGRREYSNIEPTAKAGRSVGMFGTGFLSFNGKYAPTPGQVQAFIQMCVDILPMTDDDEMFTRVAKTLSAPISGMQAAAASMILHCIKPFTFPVLNDNTGHRNIFEVLGVQLTKASALETYIDNCRRIKAFRDQNFTCKNYRIYDITAQNLDTKYILTNGGAEKTGMKKYRVNDSVWLATAILLFEKYESNHSMKRKDVYFRQADIRNLAQDLAEGNVDGARVSWWTNADNPNATQNYLRADSEDNPQSRRLSMLDEFPEKTYPRDLNEGEELTANGQTITIGQLMDFLRGTYPAILERKTNTESKIYGFEEIVSFLAEYAGKHYTAPERAGEQSEYMAEMKRRGQEARQKFISFAKEIASQIPGLEYASCSNWVNQGQVVERYLWIELKNPEWNDYPQSVSVSVSKHDDFFPGEGYYMSIRAEARDMSCKPADYQRQMRLLDYPLLDSMSYTARKKDGSYRFFGADTETVKRLCDDGTLVKLEIVEGIENLPEKDSMGSIFAEALNAAREIHPAYEYVMKDDDWWPALSEYDPGLSVQEYHDLFLDENVVKRSWLDGLHELYMMPGHLGTCSQLGERYGYASSHYVSYLTTAASNIAKKTGCPLPKEGERIYYFPVLFVGRETPDKSQGSYCWKMREPVVTAMEKLIDEGVFAMKESEEMVQFDHNMILYGPPGTGKTYNSVNYAVAICEGRSVEDVMKESYADVLVRYRDLKDAGRIDFTTFHQSYGYEEFIEGIKPKLNEESDALGYTIEAGVFKEFCKRAKAVKVQQTPGSSVMKEQPRIWGMILGGTGMTEIKKQCFDKNEIRLGWREVNDDDVDGDFSGDENVSWNAKHMVSDFKNVMEIGDIVVIEKSNKAIDAIAVVTGEYEYDVSERYPRKRAVEWLVKNIDQDMVQFLPNGRKQLSRFSLFAFDYIGMEVISQILNENTSEPTVEVEQETKPYVFIIDEINRGNISKIFGELITLIEETKRAGAAEAMEATLPYSGETFSVPKNVFILGTMNTADRSIALMDTALRRRFEFVEMMPDSEVLKSLGVGTIAVEEGELNVARMLDVINERIEYLFDREHTIGHAFFTKLADDLSMDTLAGIFEKNVIPLLQEYFYEDYEKIQLVLGDNAKEDEFKFILDKPLKIMDVFNGNPDIDLPEKKYSIQHSAFYKLESYKQIGKDL